MHSAAETGVTLHRILSISPNHMFFSQCGKFFSVILEALINTRQHSVVIQGQPASQPQQPKHYMCTQMFYAGLVTKKNRKQEILYIWRDEERSRKRQIPTHCPAELLAILLLNEIERRERLCLNWIFNRRPLWARGHYNRLFRRKCRVWSSPRCKEL